MDVERPPPRSKMLTNQASSAFPFAIFCATSLTYFFPFKTSKTADSAPKSFLTQLRISTGAKLSTPCAAIEPSAWTCSSGNYNDFDSLWQRASRNDLREFRDVSIKLHLHLDGFLLA